jgi:serine-type D-Ala-D-Ala carboxypeptidase/endopeptidase (penicillin-binding protein 4)
MSENNGAGKTAGAGRRARRLVAISLGVMIVFTIAAGAAVAHLLPARQALWRMPTVAPRRLVPASTVLGSTGDPAAGQAVTSGGVSAALSPMLGSRTLGSHVGAMVANLSSGQVLLNRLGGSGFAPASTAKLATATAALQVLGPAASFTTRVVAGPSASSIVLVGGGDPTLAAGSPPLSDYPQPATLASLATATARALQAKGVRSVHVGYDTSLFSGPTMAPGWPRGYVTTGNVTPIQSLEVDQGRLTAGGAPQDADDFGNNRPRTFTPAAQAAGAFASFLGRDGITVSGPTAQQAARASATVAAVSSPPLSEIVGQMLTESNNVIAEDLARQVAIATRRPSSFAGGAAAVTSVLAGLGVRSGVSLVDGSGLSPQDRITPGVLVQLIRLAAASGPPGLRPVITGLPVAGFSGTLAPGGSAFGGIGQPALGVVRAKTGNLQTVVSLAGIAYASNGQLLAFAFMADRLPAGGLGRGAAGLSHLAAALAGCGCR